MTPDILVLLLIGIALMAKRRIISGIKNGAFYGKNNKKARPEIKRYIVNIHRAETPAWYSQFLGMGVLVFAIARLVHPGPEIVDLLVQLGSATLITLGTSALASNDFQKWINRGVGLPDFDPKENKKSEFAFGKISIRWNTWWVGGFRKILPLLAALEVLAGILALYYL